jgi:DNA-binding NtrC family response regulator
MSRRVKGEDLPSGMKREGVSRRERILVVDDEPQIRELLCDYFSSMDYMVATARDGEEALSKFAPGLFDCVISDVVMPRIDGKELLQRLKEKDETVPVLVMTGFPGVKNAMETIRGGAYDYIIKPLDVEELRAKVERALYTRRLELALRGANRRLRKLAVTVPILLALAAILGIVLRRF